MEVARITALYGEASQFLRAADQLCHNLLQYYATIFAALIVFSSNATVNKEIAGWILVAISALFFVHASRLRRNYKYYRDTCAALERMLVPEPTLLHAVEHNSRSLRKFDIEYPFALVPTRQLYSLAYLGGAVFGLHQAGVLDWVAAFIQSLYAQVVPG